MPVVTVPAGRSVVVAVEPAEVRRVEHADLHDVRGFAPGWWAGVIGYECGRPRSTARSFPDLLFARFDARLEIGPQGMRVVGHGPGAVRLREALTRVEEFIESPPAPLTTLAEWQSDVTREQWCAQVAHTHALLRRGECYQLNLTRMLRASGSVDAAELFAHIATRHDVPYASLIRFGDTAVASASPECFLRWRGRAVSTRPIKGTGRDASELVTSDKDRTENVMIVDLARADFDRACEPGSVEVHGLLDAEEHPGLVHLVSTVVGQRREHSDVADLLHATFPAASITGVPKPRVLDLIESIEGRPRGAYCGAIGWFDTLADAGEFSVAIRTFTVDADLVELGVGGGITMASSADAEWAETELKAERLLALFDTPAQVST